MTDRIPRLTRCSKIISMVPEAGSSEDSVANTYSEKQLLLPIIDCPTLELTSNANFEEIIEYALHSDINHEIFNNSSNLDFDSDDSVLDKDYVPSSIERAKNSEDSDCSVDEIPNSQPTTLTIPETPEVSSDEAESANLTKKGEPRKRKKYIKTPAERKELKKKLDMDTKYKLKPGCNNETCKKKCHTYFTISERENLNIEFRKMSWKDQQYFLKGNTCKEKPKRNTVNENNRKLVRNVTVSYFLPIESGNKVNVCKVFFLETLGYNRKNDKPVRNALYNINVNIKEKRGCFPNPKKIDESKIIEHINLFNPAISHYRREHAPNRRYLPSDLTVTKMYQDFCEKENINPASEQISYDAYRKILKKQNISFTKLGNEQCDVCAVYFIHNPEHKVKRHRNCKECRDYERHRYKYTLARQEYKNDVEKQNKTNINSDSSYYSADLEKVIMLPRMEEFKKVVFCQRIIVFNESFVPIGDKKNNPAAHTFSAIWHEAVAGRKVHDITSCFRSFLLSVRDLKHVIIWLDNCASQNKNWTLFTYLLNVVNSTEVNFETVTLKYLEAGHTHMSADEFHHQVELSMKKKNHLYDFEDFNQAVTSTRSNITVKSMSLNDFFQFEDCSSVYKLQNSSPRAYLGDMCQVIFTRGTHKMCYKTNFNQEEEYTLDFLKIKYIKSGIPPPKQVKEYRGVTYERKTSIIQKLTPLMPDNRRQFWYDLPVNRNSTDLTQED